MMHAEAGRLMATARPFTATHNVRPGTECLVAIADNEATLRSLEDALLAAGVEPRNIERLWGRSGLDQLADDEGRGGLLGTLGRWLGALGPEAGLARHYRRELARGHALILTRHMSRAAAHDIHERLHGSGGRCMQHYGRFSVTYLAA